MPYRMNGCGTTVSPMPDKGAYSVAMQWVTLFFVPIIPLGFVFIKGAGGGSYYILKKLSYKEAKKALGMKGLILTLGYGIIVGVVIFVILAIIITIFQSL